MKSIQIIFDEKLLAAFDEDENVKREGRSAVISKIIAEYLQRSQQSAVDRQYRQAYGNKNGLDEEFEGWENEAQWLVVR